MRKWDRVNAHDLDFVAVFLEAKLILRLDKGAARAAGPRAEP